MLRVEAMVCGYHVCVGGCLRRYSSVGRDHR